MLHSVFAAALAQKLANYIGQATETAFGWLKIATQAIVNAGADDAAAVTAKKLANATQAQAFTAFTTSGAPGVLTLTPVPAITAYAANQRFRVKFGLVSTGADTINVSGRGAKSIKQYDATGAKIPAVFFVGQLADVEYDGTDMVVLDPLPTAAASDATSAVKGITRFATSAETLVGTDNGIAVTPAGLASVIPIKSQCTAWVNFNGTGTVAIRDSYNCLSVTDNGTGDYTINWLNQTKITYSFSTGTSLTGGTSGVGLRIDVANAIYTATQLRLVNGSGTAAVADAAWASVQIFGGR
ncbi:hypothetical protein HBO38_04510 [Pseudomonas veronii]|uniref:Uncharacterized protein n=1 Tax=Pseudomonas veronii TaxID=76761 RepID=A0A7Y1A2B6_PSEVE|nr:hypothetical protein [Pseudomonas veronii]NMY07721.1 hypothetical protein [Pseudomonas veronii]